MNRCLCPFIYVPVTSRSVASRRQNNRMLRQCPSGIAQRPPHHAVAVPTAMQSSYKDNARSSAVGNQPKQKKSNSLAQHHLPALDLFWASFFVRVRLTSLLLISPGLCLLDRVSLTTSPCVTTSRFPIHTGNFVGQLRTRHAGLTKWYWLIVWIPPTPLSHSMTRSSGLELNW